MTTEQTRPAAPHRVVIVGAGFGGLEVTYRLAGAPVSVTLVDRRNHHLFQPLLYQVATASLNASDVAEPIRKVLADQPNTEVLLAEVDRIDVDAKTLTFTDGDGLGYDYLIVAA